MIFKGNLAPTVYLQVISHVMLFALKALLAWMFFLDDFAFISGKFKRRLQLDFKCCFHWKVDEHSLFSLTKKKKNKTLD